MATVSLEKHDICVEFAGDELDLLQFIRFGSVTGSRVQFILDQVRNSPWLSLDFVQAKISPDIEKANWAKVGFSHRRLNTSVTITTIAGMIPFVHTDGPVFASSPDEFVTRNGQIPFSLENWLPWYIKNHLCENPENTNKEKAAVELAMMIADRARESFRLT